MSDKPKATSATASEGETSRVEGDRTVGEQANRAAGTGRGVTSPMDNPTEQFSAVRAGDVPRTDEELGLEPDVPTVRDRATAVESAEAAASGGATAARTRGRSGETRKAASLTKKPTATDPASEAETTALPKTTASPKTTGAPKTAAVPQDAAVSQDAAVPEDGADRTTEPIDDGGETAAYAYASIPPAANTPGERSKSARRRPAENRRGTLDLGLLVLRVVVGATFLYHGLQKATGWFHGSGLDGTRDMMAEGGWDHPTLSTILLVVGEIGGGALLILGLATPLAAGAVLAVILNAWAWKQGMLPGFQFNSSVPTGVEIDTILAGAAVAIILTGPGRLSLDRGRGWATRPFVGSFTALLLAVVAAGLTYWYLHGGNPLTGIGPFD
ncbi:MAG TPA: DoxX family membrane protein [Nocardia sp.]|uniref:DoxX family membrane protein n=1 Tax=Nocardia sp. TaxID=1821 RepID=UPI002B4ABC1A|nr:DoxX family membrane protein [Nocardia sp.]HLS79338.1 DoxX family membrane protein [Nocardia sp.]